MADPQAAPPRPSAEEVFKKYGSATVVLLALTIWFAYDGWYNPDIQAKGFNKVGAVLLGLSCIYSAVMASSAGRAVRRQRQQQPQPPQ
jgi:hypothetical protein